MGCYQNPTFQNEDVPCPFQVYIFSIYTYTKTNKEKTRRAFPNWRNKLTPSQCSPNYFQLSWHLITQNLNLFCMKGSEDGTNREEENTWEGGSVHMWKNDLEESGGTCAEERLNMCCSGRLHYNSHINWFWHWACEQGLNRFVELACMNTYWGNLHISTYSF